MNTKYKIRNTRYGIAILLLFFVVAPGVAYASTLYFTVPDEPIYEGDVFSIEVRVDSKEEAINAVQADVEFGSDFFEASQADNTNSILSFWPRVPTFDNKTGDVLFSGGLPSPGFQASGGLVGKITFRADKVGQTSLNFSNTSRVLLNDGLGTETSLDKRNISLTILNAPEGYQPKGADVIRDTTPPDAFTPIISHNKYIYDGKYFVAFKTKDYESGISHYEVREKVGDIWGDWKTARSPQVLQNQRGEVTVFVKAIDRAGNEQVGVLKVNIPKKKLYLLYILIIAVLLTIFIVILRRKILKFVIAKYQKVKFWQRN